MSDVEYKYASSSAWMRFNGDMRPGRNMPIAPHPESPPGSRWELMQTNVIENMQGDSGGFEGSAVIVWTWRRPKVSRKSKASG